jgi:glycosyltransferase involved in cell wall biosynthesis
MRIVMVAPQIGDAFGQERVLSRSCDLLSGAGHDVYLLGQFEAGQLPAHREKLLLPGLFSYQSLSPLAKIRETKFKVSEFLRRVNPNVVHLHDTPDFRFIRLFSKSYATLLTAHTISPTCPSSARLTSNSSPCTQTSGWACLLHNRGYGCLNFLKSDLRRAHAIHNYLLRRRALRKGLRGIVAISEYVEKTLVADGWDPTLIRRIPNPVVVPAVAPLPNAPSPLWVYAARLSPLKGLEILLHALVPLRPREWTLWVCGEGSERARLEELSQSLGLKERVVFKGQTTPALTASIMRSATAVIAPNLGPETFGLSVAEACLLGVPVIASRMPALDELIVDGQTGLLFPPADAVALTACLESVLDAPGAARDRAAAAKTLVEKKFSPQAHLQTSLKVYEAAWRAAPGSDLKATQRSEAFSIR